MKQFYSHLIKIESIVVELDKMDLTDEQKAHLAGLVDSSLHHTVLDAVLSELSEENKRVFLNHLREDNYGKIWQFLNEKVDNIEDKIKKAAEDLVQEMHEDIKETQNSKLKTQK